MACKVVRGVDEDGYLVNLAVFAFCRVIGHRIYQVVLHNMNMVDIVLRFVVDENIIAVVQVGTAIVGAFIVFEGDVIWTRVVAWFIDWYCNSIYYAVLN